MPHRKPEDAHAIDVIVARRYAAGRGVPEKMDVVRVGG
jgi:hypothetical protein